VTGDSVLVPSGGKSVGLVLQLKEALRTVGPLRSGRVLVADRAAVTPAGSFADGSFRVPDAASPDYVDALLRLCGEEGVRVLLPVIDVDLDRLAPHKDAFAALGTALVSPPPHLKEMCLDKRRFEAFCVQCGLPHPRSYGRSALAEAPFPLFAKKRRGFGSIGSGIVRTPEDARHALAQDPDLFFQELVQAGEVSVDAYVSRDGRCLVRVPRLRDRVVGGEVHQSHTVRSPAVAALADRTIEALARRGLTGPLNIQIFASPEPVLIEVNTRLGSGCVLSDAATGGRLLATVLQDACGAVCEGDPDDYAAGLWLQRYWGHVVHDGVRAISSHPDPVGALEPSPAAATSGSR
jgi:carbamoyl-phosphate synthase large subunit